MPGGRPLKGTAESRFWSRVAKGEGCWVWRGKLTVRGYGHFRAYGASPEIKAHRFSWELAYGQVPPGYLVCHRCDNPPCVRPDHLFIGTNADNIADAMAKGRTARGSRNSHAKLRAEDVREIRVRYKTGLWRQHDLARAFGVSRPNIGAIVRGVTWFEDVDAPDPLDHPTRPRDKDLLP